MPSTPPSACAARQGVDALVQHRRAVAADALDVLLRCLAAFQLFEVKVTILEEHARGGAEQVVGPDEIGLAGRPQALLPPAPAAGHDAVELVDRKLRHQLADHDALVDHGGRHEGLGRAVGRQVVGEILQACRRGVRRLATARRGGGEVRRPVGAGAQRRAELGFLLDRVDDAAGAVVDQEEVGEVQRRRRRAHQRVVDRVQLVVGAAGGRFVDQLAPVLGIGIVDDVPVLQEIGRRPDRQELLDRRLGAEQPAHPGHVVVVVPVENALAHLGWHRPGIELVDGVAEAAHGVDHHLRGGEQAQLVADAAEVDLDLVRLGLARRGELVEDRLFERVAGAHVAQHAGDQHGDGAQQDQDGEQLGRQPEARGTTGGGRGRNGRIGDGHASLLYTIKGRTMSQADRGSGGLRSA